MTCPRCRSANVEGAPFCASCGGPLARPVAQGPVRKGLAVASLVLGVLSLPTFGLLGIGAILAIVFGILALTKVSRQPEEFGGKGMAIGGIVCGGISVLVFPVLIIAAIAIPSLLRARITANESAAIGDVRSVIAAEMTYQSMTGAYGSLECLAQPSGCGSKGGSVSLVDAALASSAPRHGYRLRVILGAPSTSSDAAGGASDFVVVAVPVKFGGTGMKAFCGDATGEIHYTRDDREPQVVGGRCVEADVIGR
jgi:type IV pilus assembly protein PilA